MKSLNGGRGLLAGARPRAGEDMPMDRPGSIDGLLWGATFEETEAQFPAPYPGSVVAFQHGNLTVKMWQAMGQESMFWHDHTQDEVYVVFRGSATFVRGEQRRPCKAGDVLFVRAGEHHNFVDFTTDFVLWIFLYGPQGGEKR
jgi:mannose-6-phosphate isomerase-like protein (cupin superfamily)